MNDLRLALRSLAKSPGFTAVAVLTLALGVGVNTSMFSLINAVLLQSPPYSAPEELVRLYRTSPQSQTWPHSPANLADVQAENTSFSSMAWLEWGSFSLAEPGQPAEMVRGQKVSTDFFRTLGVAPQIGRVFSPEEQVPGRASVIVLSHALWQARFGGDPRILGRTIRVDGSPVTVVGVMPAEFAFPILWGRVEAWRPLALSDQARQQRGTNWLAAFARLRPGVTLAQAQADASAIAGRLAERYPGNNVGVGLRLVELGSSSMNAAGRTVSYLVFALSGFVLLIACANLANLQLARAMARLHEFAIRAALGASRGRLIRGILAESLVLAIGGGLLGLLLAVWTSDLLAQRIEISDGVPLKVATDWSVVGFALATASLTGVVFGLWPAWRGSRTDVSSALKSQGRALTAGRAEQWLRHSTLVAEVALALMLLGGAGFFIGGLQQHFARPLGWSREQVLTASLQLPPVKYPDAPRRLAFGRQLEEKLAALPGVQSTALATALPLHSYTSSRNLVPEGAPPPVGGRAPLAFVTSVTPGFFSALQIPLRRGQLFAAESPAGAPRVVVLNETMARQFWPGEDPIGKRLGNPGPDNREWLTVVGVVGDVDFAGNIAAPDTRLQVYVPFTDQPSAGLHVVLRTAVPPSALASRLRDAVASVDADLPVGRCQPLSVSIERAQRDYRTVEILLGAFSALGLVLAAIGLYGVASQLVVRRTSEFGLRLALGAQPSGILRLVLTSGLRLVATGTVIGLVGAVVLTRVCGTLMPDLPGNNPWFLAASVIALGLVMLFACWLPARRATRVNPIEALRAE